MKVLSIDELNTLDSDYVRKSIPYDEYFGEMDLPKEGIEKRKKFAGLFESIMIFAMYLIINSKGKNVEIEPLVVSRYKDLAKDYVDLDESTENYIAEFVKNFVRVTRENIDNPYFLSIDRAMLNAENEANTMLNYGDYQEAIKKGFTKKQWHDEQDGKVRKTHRKVNKNLIPIKDVYLVGDSIMLFPKDTSFGADAEEIVNCRCTITYSK